MSSHRDGVGPVQRGSSQYAIDIFSRDQCIARYVLKTWVTQVQRLLFASDQLTMDALACVYQDALTPLHKVDDVPRVRQHVLAVAHAVHGDVGGEGVPDVLVQVGLNLALLKAHC